MTGGVGERVSVGVDVDVVEAVGVGTNLRVGVPARIGARVDAHVSSGVETGPERSQKRLSRVRGGRSKSRVEEEEEARSRMRRFRYVPMGMGWGLRYDRRRGVIDEIEAGDVEREYGIVVPVGQSRFRRNERR